MRTNQQHVIKMLCRGSGIRDYVAATGVSKSTVLRWIKSVAAGLTLKPQKHHYSTVQIDEQRSYVGRKEKKVWMLYAYTVEEEEIIAFTIWASEVPRL